MRPDWDPRSNETRRSDAEAIKRQAQRAQDPGKSLDDTLGTAATDISRRAWSKALTIIACSLAAALIVALPGGLSFLPMAAVPGTMTTLLILGVAPSTFDVQEGAGRHLRGEDERYWVRMHSLEDRHQHSEIWFETSAADQARRDADPPMVPFLALVAVVNTAFWAMAVA